jgi:uncharacterized protein YrrD
MSTRLVKGTAVISLADGAKLGAIDHVYLDPRRKEIVGFSFHSGGLFGKTSNMVDVSDVHSIGPDAVTLTDTSAVRSEIAINAKCEDLIELDDLLKRKVVTEGGTFVGQVTCIEFGLDSYRLTQIAVSSGLMRGTDTIHADDILNVAGELVVVSDAVCGAEAGGQVQAVAVA